jgi:SAM-dependent methyltransferase
MEPDWYRRWFDQRYLDVYGHRDEREAARLVDTLLKRLPLPGRALIYDIACGSGRHARRLADRGHRVVGIDLSRSLLGVAAGDRSGGPFPHYVRADMRRLPLTGGTRGADLVINLFTAFGYFHQEAENIEAFLQMAHALKPGGRLVLDYLNRSRVIGSLVPDDEQQQGGIMIRQQRRLVDDAKRIEKQITLTFSDGGVEAYRESVRLYGRDDLERLAGQAGLEPQMWWGDYDGGDFTPSSPRCILIALAV